MEAMTPDSAPVDYRVLFIDDDPDMLKLMSAHFGVLGYETHQAENGPDGLSRYDEQSPDVVVLDMQLPDMGGMEVLEELRRRSAVVIILTAHGDFGTALKAMQRGAENFLIKPADMGHLELAVRRAAEKQR